MLRSNSKSLGDHVVSPEEEKERLQWGRICRKGRFEDTSSCFNVRSKADITRVAVGLIYQTDQKLKEVEKRKKTKT